MAIALDHQLAGHRLTLRRFALSDAAAVQAIMADWDVVRLLRRAKYPPNLEEIIAWLASHEAEWMSSTAYRFAASFKGRVVGCADIANINHGTGALGYWFERASWGSGFAGEAAGLVKDFAIRTVGLHRIVAGHAIENVASGRVLLRTGFKPTGDDVLRYPLLGQDLPYRRYVLDVEGQR